MSMWEIEALMENTVRLIDKSNFESNKKRNLIWNTYSLQNQFDCSFTHFRLMDILIKNEYVQQYDIQDFPLTNSYPDFFAELPNKDFEWIYKIPTEKWSKNNLTIAYWEKKSNTIFTDFGSEFYTLNKDEAPEKYEPLLFSYIIIKEGNKQKDKSIIYDWTSFLTNYVLGWFPVNEPIQKLKDAYFSEIKNIFHKFDYTDYKALHKGLDINTINESWLAEMPQNQKELIKYLMEK